MSEQAIRQLLNDYPRLWENINPSTKPDTGRIFRQIRKYPLSINVLSTALEFHRWVMLTCQDIAETTSLPLPKTPESSLSGPDPRVLSRLSWMDMVWSTLKERDKLLSEMLTEEIVFWRNKLMQESDEIRWRYLPTQTCPLCHKNTVMHNQTFYLCVNTDHFGFYGDWFTWEKNVDTREN